MIGERTFDRRRQKYREDVCMNIFTSPAFRHSAKKEVWWKKEKKKTRVSLVFVKYPALARTPCTLFASHMAQNVLFILCSILITLNSLFSRCKDLDLWMCHSNALKKSFGNMHNCTASMDDKYIFFKVRREMERKEDFGDINCIAFTISLSASLLFPSSSSSVL